jgi:hypothetical protein
MATCEQKTSRHRLLENRGNEVREMSCPDLTSQTGARTDSRHRRGSERSYQHDDEPPEPRTAQRPNPAENDAPQTPSRRGPDGSP